MRWAKAGGSTGAVVVVVVVVVVSASSPSRLVHCLPLLVDAEVDVEETQFAGAALTSLKHLTPSRVRTKTNVSTRAYHGQVRHRVGDRRRGGESGRAEIDSLASRRSVEDVRQTVNLRFCFWLKKKKKREGEGRGGGMRENVVVS